MNTDPAQPTQPEMATPHFRVVYSGTGTFSVLSKDNMAELPIGDERMANDYCKELNEYVEIQLEAARAEVARLKKRVGDDVFTEVYQRGKDESHREITELRANLASALQTIENHECALRSMDACLAKSNADLAASQKRADGLAVALRWYAGNNSWADYCGPDEHHPKIRDCGQIAKAALAQHDAEEGEHQTTY
jgi:hypothetical protein